MESTASKSNQRMFHLRPFVVLALGLILAITTVFFLSAITMLLLAVFSLAAALYFHKRIGITLLLIALAVGLLRMSFAIPKEYSNGEYNVCGRVHDINGSTVTLSSATVNGLRISGYISFESDMFRLDDIVALRGRLNYSVNNPDSSYKLYYLSENITATVSYYDEAYMLTNRATPNGFFKKIRNSISVKIDELFSDSAPIIKGILLGNTSEISSSTLSSVRIAGTAHILALSGLHVTILCSFIRFIFPAKGKLRFYGVTCFLLLYCLITGFSPSLVRASVIFITSQLFVFRDKMPDTLSMLSLAAIIILIIRPFQLFSVGFLMSFSCFLGIILVGTGIITKINLNKKEERRHSDSYSSPFVTCFSATIGILPVSVGYFEAISIYSIPTNLVLIPMASIGILLSAIAVSVGFLSDTLGKILAFIPRCIFMGFTFVCDCIAKLPAAIVPAHSPSVITCALFFFGLIMCSTYPMLPRSHSKRHSIAMLFLLFSVASYTIT